MLCLLIADSASLHGSARRAPSASSPRYSPIPEVSITQVGTAVALGVLLDTLIVRTILIPASLLTIGERVAARPAQNRRARR